VQLEMSALGQKRTRALQQKERPVRDASKLIRTYDRNTYAAEKKAALDSYWPSVQQRPLGRRAIMAVT
jgi:hypothetical protein